MEANSNSWWWGMAEKILDVRGEEDKGVGRSGWWFAGKGNRETERESGNFKGLLECTTII